MALSEVLFVLLIVAVCTGLPALVFYYLLRLVKQIWALIIGPQDQPQRPTP